MICFKKKNISDKIGYFNCENTDEFTQGKYYTLKYHESHHEDDFYNVVNDHGKVKSCDINCFKITEI